jgi:hypothetical protein
MNSRGYSQQCSTATYHRATLDERRDTPPRAGASRDSVRNYGLCTMAELSQAEREKVCGAHHCSMGWIAMHSWLENGVHGKWQEQALIVNGS